MLKMQNLNVVRIVETEEQKAALEAQGFKEIVEVKPDYDNMTLNDLKAIAKDKEIENYSTMKKDDLIAVLKAPDNEESKQK
jgi:hypothetical protein